MNSSQLQSRGKLGELVRGAAKSLRRCSPPHQLHPRQLQPHQLPHISWLVLALLPLSLLGVPGVPSVPGVQGAQAAQTDRPAESNAESNPVSYRRDVQAVLSKAGCNLGACHGNQHGKGGLFLSLRGQDPTEDFLTLTDDLGGRRLNRVVPEQSLLLLKPAAQVPHVGGQRFASDSLEFAILRRWIAEGMHDDGPERGRVTRLTVSPTEAVAFAPTRTVPLRVTATFADGTERDVTRLAVYESSAYTTTVDAQGVAQRQADGEATIMVRYLHQQTSARIAFMPGGRDAEAVAAAWSHLPQRNVIDQHVQHKLVRLRIPPSPLTDDRQFLRRAYLDTLGLLPTPAESERFLRSQATDKRDRLIDELLSQPAFADHWALKWSDVLRNEEKVLDATGVEVFHRWIRDSIAHGMPLNRFATDLVSSLGSTYKNPPTNFYRAHRDPTTRSVAVARVFLGYRLQCAQCHNHPYDNWTQDDYYDWAAVFAKIDYEIKENKRRDEFDKNEFVGEQVVRLNAELQVQNPRLAKAARPRLLGSASPLIPTSLPPAQPAPTSPDSMPPAPRSSAVPAPAGAVPAAESLAAESPRTDAPRTEASRTEASRAEASNSKTPNSEAPVPASEPLPCSELDQLARWLGAPENRAFARAQVNRIWYHLMGRGLVEPVDDFRVTNPPSHPELMEALVDELIRSNYDLRHIVRLIMQSTAYQLDSLATSDNQLDASNYSHAALRRMSAEQILDAQAQVLGVTPRFAGYEPGIRAGQLWGVERVRPRDVAPSAADRFLKMFGKPDRLLACECERTDDTHLGQALTLTAGEHLQQMLAEPHNRIGRGMAEGKNPREMVEQLYAWALARLPHEAEIRAAEQLIDAQQPRAGLEDVAWAILNSKEFLFRP